MMDRDRYSELFNTVSRWILASRQQYYIAGVLTPHFETAMAEFAADSENGKTLHEKAEMVRALANACALHLGLAIENSTKAKQIFEGKITVENGTPKGLRTDHNTLEHVRQCGVTLNKEEEIFLKRLSYQVNSLAKYPIAKNLNNQNDFTGVIVGGSTSDHESVLKVIHRVLRDEQLISIFDEGKLL